MHLFGSSGHCTLDLRSVVAAVITVLTVGCGGGEAEHAAAAQSGETYAYNFVASRRHDEPAECGARPLALELMLQQKSSKVRAVIASQDWSCSDLDADGAAYYSVCSLPSLESPLGASLMIVLFEQAPNARINGEAVLTLSSPTGTCEHSYELDGELEG
jgi:hypothetical protein